MCVRKCIAVSLECFFDSEDAVIEVEASARKDFLGEYVHQMYEIFTLPRTHTVTEFERISSWLQVNELTEKGSLKSLVGKRILLGACYYSLDKI